MDDIFRDPKAVIALILGLFFVSASLIKGYLSKRHQRKMAIEAELRRRGVAGTVDEPVQLADPFSQTPAQPQPQEQTEENEDGQDDIYIWE